VLNGQTKTQSDDWIQVTEAAGDLLVENLEGENVISLYLMSEMDTDEQDSPYSVSFEGLVLADGAEMLAPPRRSDLKLHFIGDSDSVGYGVWTDYDDETDNYYSWVS